MDGRARAGPDGDPDAPTVQPTPAGVRRPARSAEAATEAAADPGPSTNGPSTNGNGANGNGANGNGANGQGTDGSGTLRRIRAPRVDGDPSRRAASETPPGAAPPAAPPAPSPIDGSQAVHRPVPPTFPSPGQPPPGVARRAGRHARPDRRGEQHHTPPHGYRPRHAAPDAETEQFAAPAATDDAVTDSAPIPAADGSGGPAFATAPAGPSAPLRPVADPDGRALDGDRARTDDSAHPLDDASDRVRIVLAERRSPTRAVRTVAEIEAQTETGELLLGNLLRAQLTLAVRLALVALVLLGAVPVLFLVLPALGTTDIVGLRVPWWLVGVLPYPFLAVLGWLYIRAAERNELDFADNVED